MDTLLRLAPALYETAFWVSLALIPTLLAIYTLSVSLLGPAFSIASTAGMRLRRSISAEIERLRSASSGAQAGAVAIRDVERRLRDCRRELATAQRVTGSFNLRSTVLAPGVAFLVTALMAQMPRAMTAPGAVPHALWLLTLVPLGVGGFLLLGVVRTVRSVVELSVPDLDVAVDVDPGPWHVGRFHKIRLRAVLHKGNALPATQLVLLVPPSCEFRGSPIWTVAADDPVMPGYKALGSTVWDYRAWAPFQWEFHHLEPRAEGPLTFYYSVYGQTYSTPPHPIAVNVES